MGLMLMMMVVNVVMIAIMFFMLLIYGIRERNGGYKSNVIKVDC